MNNEPLTNMHRLSDAELAGYLRSPGSLTWNDCWNIVEHLRHAGVIAYGVADSVVATPAVGGTWVAGFIQFLRDKGYTADEIAAELASNGLDSIADAHGLTCAAQETL